MGGLAFPSLDDAIARFEGFGTPGSVATRNNNPGNLIYGPFAVSHGAVGQSGSFAVFPDAVTGANAEDSLISAYAQRGATLSDLISGWAPPNAPGNSPAGTQSYLDFVTGATGANATDPLTKLAGQSPTTTTSQTGAIKTAYDWLNAFLSPFPAMSLANQSGVLTYQRIGAFILGLIMIAGGIYLFKNVQQGISVVVEGGKKAVKTASTVTEIAG